MLRKQKNINWILPLIICTAFILCAAIGMLIYPDAFYKLISVTQIIREIPPQLPHTSYYWDVLHYSEMATNPSCKAFYPLWPFIIRNLFHPQTIEQAASYFVMISTIIFFTTNFLMYWVLKAALKSTYLAFWIMLAFTVNPMAIFRVIGYTESLFSLFSIVFIWCCLPNNKANQYFKLCLLIFVIFLMSLTRPILVQVFFSTTLTLVTMVGLESLRANTYSWDDFLIKIRNYHHEIKTTLIIWLAAIVGYAVYGSYCLKTRGNFFAPFNDQRLWGKSLGIHLELLLFPKSPLIDIIALYLPLIILCLSLVITYYKFAKNQNIISLPKYRIWWSILYLYPPLLILVYIGNLIFMKIKKSEFNQIQLSNDTNYLAVNYIFWVCIYFATAHSLIQFFTFDRLMSLGRYIFATPFFFVGLGYLYRCIPGKIKYQTLFLITCISIFMLVEQWVNYGQHKWLG